MPSSEDVLAILQSDAVEQCVDGCLTLELPSLDLGFGHLYGGQAYSQATLAAQYWLDREAPSLRLHMAQGVFLKAGTAHQSVRYEVHPVGRGRTFQRMDVQAFQGDKLVFQALASAQKPEEPFLQHQLSPSQLPEPESLMSYSELKTKLTGKPPVGQFPIEIRVATPEVYLQKMAVTDKQGFWFRYNLPNSKPSFAQCQSLLGYASDYGFLGALFISHHAKARTAPFFLTSLDHSVWYYSHYEPDKWAYFESESPVAAHGRGLVIGRFFQENRLVAVATQEGLLRSRERKVSA